MISAQNKQEQSSAQVVLRQDMMQESQTTNATIPGCVNSVGYLTDKPHQSTEVFNTNALAPCMDATMSQHPRRIVECTNMEETQTYKD